jgi:uncharacterized protein (DUF952 family)
VSEFIYKVLTLEEWEAFSDQGWFSGTSADTSIGYIHLSGPTQLEGTMIRHYREYESVVVLEISQSAVSMKLRWEPSRRGELYPHLYDGLRLEEVSRAVVVRVGIDAESFDGEVQDCAVTAETTLRASLQLAIS